MRRLTPARVIAGLVALAVAAAAVAGLAALRVGTQPEAFLPEGDQTVRELEAAARTFGGDPIVVLAESPEPGQLLGPDQLPLVRKLEGQLAALPDVAVVYGPGTVLNEIAIASQNLLAQLFGRRDGARMEAEQQARATGAPPSGVTAAGDAAVAAFDARYAPLLVQGLPAGLPTLRNPAFVKHVVFEEPTANAGAVPRPRWRFVVPAPNALSILVRPRENLDQAATDRLVSAVDTAVRGSGLTTKRVTVAGAPAVAASLADQVRREIPLLGGLAVGLIALCYLAVPWLGRRRLRLLPIAATLMGTGLTLAVFGWLGRPLSLGAMAFLPILIGIGSDFPAYLVQRTHRRRVVVAALASSAGFASLAVSPLPFVRDLGLALALGVLLALGSAFALRRWLVGEPAPESDRPSRPVPARSSRMRLTVGALAVAMAAVGWVALPRLDLEARPDQLAAGIPAVSDTRHAEQVLGSSGEVRVVLRGPNVLAPEALDWMHRAQSEVVLRHGDQLRSILGLPDLLRFLGPSPTPDEISSAAALLPRYLVAATTTPDAKQAVLSFGVQLQDLGGQKRLLDALRHALPATPPGFAIEVTGLPVVAARGYELISGNRYASNLVGIAAAALVLLIGLRRRRSDAARAAAAAVLATGWGLFVMLALGISLSPLTVALGSLTTATACEFTILLAGAGDRGRAALRRTVLVAAAAAAVGYATLAASGLVVIREFGLLLSLTVLLSLASAHLVLMLFPDRRGETAMEVPRGEPTRAVVSV